MSWVLDVNTPLTNALDKLGAVRDKEYAMMEMSLLRDTGMSRSCPELPPPSCLSLMPDPASPQFVFFDLDDTLLDHRGAEGAGARRPARLARRPLWRGASAHALHAAYRAANAPLWADFAAGTITSDDLKRLRSQGTLDALGRDEPGRLGLFGRLPRALRRAVALACGRPRRLSRDGRPRAGRHSHEWLLGTAARQARALSRDRRARLGRRRLGRDRQP